MGLKNQFATDKRLEKEGILLNYGTDRIRAARAGGANKKFAKVLEAKTRSIRRALAVGAVDNDRSNAILAETYAEAVILNWEHNVGSLEEPEWKVGIDPEDAGKNEGDAGSSGKELLSVTVENVKAVLLNLPDLFTDIQEQVKTGMLFRAELNEAGAGN